MKSAFVYILASQKNGTLYVGVTSNIQDRMYQHKKGVYKGFSSKYGCDKLVYLESGAEMRAAIVREKFIKGKSRAFKIDLIEGKNPDWDDLSADWFL